MPGINSRDVTPLDLTPLAIIAIIAIMQVRALAPLLLGRQSLSPKLVIDLAVSTVCGFPAKHLLHSGTSTRSGFAGPFLCYCCCRARFGLIV
jgi:hypothetical protein